MAEADVIPIDGEEARKEKTPKQWHQHWQREKLAAQKRLRNFVKQGNGVVKRFLGETSADEWGNSPYHTSRLNLFHTNVSTMQSMLYGSVPRIDVAREHHDPDDDVARVACLMYQRILQADVDPSGSDVPSNLKAALQDRLLPGLGQCRIRYDYTAEQETVLNPETMEPEEVEVLTDERAPTEYVHWQDFLWGWGRTWSEVEWVGFRSWMSKRGCTDRFGAKIASQLSYKAQTPTGGDKDGDDSLDERKNSVQKAEIWEFWNKNDKRVYWYNEGADLILDAKDDPLELDGFFPCPKPMTANVTTTLFQPKADFIFAQDLYNEIDELQTRITIITRAIKVVGVYDKAAGDSVGRMLKEGAENDLIPVDNWAMFAEKGALKGVIDWFPVETIVGTLQTLQQLRDNAIENLYQITGMSDILRGAKTDQYAAEGTQQLKAKFGSIRIQALQDEFARFASDLEGLKAEIISKHFDEASILRQASAQFLPKPDLDKVLPAMQLMKQADVKWRIDIRPESIAMIDYQALKAERTEFLMAMAQYIQSAQAAAKEMPGALPLLLEMMKWGMQGFKGANYLEGIMDQAIDLASKPQQGQGDKGPSPEEVKLQTEQMKQQTEQMKIQGDMQKIQAKAQADLQTAQMKIQGEIQKIQVDAERDLTFEQTQQQNKLLEIARELEASIQEVQANMQADIEVENAQAQADLTLEAERHANDIEQIIMNARTRPRNAQ